MQYLSELPNELWLIILSYLDIVNIFEAFDGLNQRFNDLIYGSARHVTLPYGTLNTWIDAHILNLQDRIEIISLHENNLENLFGRTWSFPNLRLINLQGMEWNMTLRIEEKPLSIILMSSLKFLSHIAIYGTIFSDYTRNLIRNAGAEYNEDFPCPFIECLSIDIQRLRSLLIIRTYIPNLRHLKINYVQTQWHEFPLIYQSDLIETPTRLITLQITANRPTDLHLLEDFITSYKNSLQKLVLDIFCVQSIDGNYFESICKSFLHLKKLTFFFLNNTFDLTNGLYSFQSEWWLDRHRPPVYIQHDDNHYVIVASMPFHRLFNFKNNLYNWNINKGDRYSSFIRFDMDQIHFTNKIHQSIDLDYLYSIHRIFTSSNQSLSFDYSNLETVNVLYELLIDGISMEPILFNVKQFRVSSKHQIDCVMLSVWILLMPNLQKLNIAHLTTFNKRELANGLINMIDDEKRLQSNFYHINELIIFSSSDDRTMKDQLSDLFGKIFMNAIVY